MERDVQSNVPGMQASSRHLLPLVGSPTVLLPNHGHLSMSVLDPSEEAILALHLSVAYHRRSTPEIYLVVGRTAATPER